MKRKQERKTLKNMKKEKKDNDLPAPATAPVQATAPAQAPAPSPAPAPAATPAWQRGRPRKSS